MELIKKIYPINAKEDKKKASYEINDNLLRFYYSYIYRRKSQLELLGADLFYDQYIEPSITTFISHRFEDIARTYFSILAKKGKLNGIYDIGTYYYDDSRNKTNGDFAVALKFEDSYSIYECKYYKKDITHDEILNKINQVKQIKGININKIGFINASNQVNISSECEIISGSDLYNV